MLEGAGAVHHVRYVEDLERDAVEDELHPGRLGPGLLAPRAGRQLVLALELDHVSFSYKPGVTVLDKVSLTARRGEKIALVGPTGSGKTTAVSLF